MVELKDVAAECLVVDKVSVNARISFEELMRAETEQAGVAQPVPIARAWRVVQWGSGGRRSQADNSNMLTAKLHKSATWPNGLRITKKVRN